MDEKTIIDLISQSVRHILREADYQWIGEREKEIATHIADTAWNGLILGMREMLASGKDLVFEELGRFEKVKSRWLFDPADSMIEAGALALEPQNADKYMAEYCLFYLSQATELIDRISSNIKIHYQRPEEELLEDFLVMKESDLERKYYEILQKQLKPLFASIEDLKSVLEDKHKQDKRFPEIIDAILEEPMAASESAVMEAKEISVPRFVKAVPPAAKKTYSRMYEKLKATKKAAKKKKPIAVKKASQVTETDKILQIIKRFRKGVDVRTLKTKTGFNQKKIQNIIYRSHKSGKIKRIAKGVYGSVKER